MRESSDVEVFLERLCRPPVRLLKRLFRPLARYLAIPFKPFCPVWSWFWGWVFADDFPSGRGIAARASYQRSYIPAYLLIGTVVVALVFGLRSGEPTIVTLNDARPITVVDMYVPNKETADTSETLPGAKQNVPKYVQHGSGFLGFIDLRPRDVALPDPLTTVPSEIYAVDPPILFNEEEPISFSPVEGDEDTVVIPADADYVWTEFEKASNDRPEPVNHGVVLIHKVSPAVPPSAEMMGLGGYAEILMLIDKDGNPANYSVRQEDSAYTYPEFHLDCVLDDGTKATLKFYVDAQNNKLRYVTIKEDPKEFKFAEYVLAVLPDWRFAPAIKDSEPVDAFVRIGINFCLPDDEDCVEIVLIPM